MIGLVSYQRSATTTWPYPTRRWLYLAVGFHVACALVLGPVTSHPYDLAVLSGTAQAWLNWGVPLLYNWKFGLDYAAFGVLAQGLRAFLAGLGMPGIVALHIAWKLPLVAANLLTAGVIYRLGLRLAPDRAALLAALWLLNPVVLWVSAGHGQIESIAILCLFGALQLALDRRLFWSGLVTGIGVGFEYFPIAVAGSIIVWWRGGQLTGRRPLLSFGVGLLLSLASWFVPSLVDPIGRTSLFEGLAFSGGLASTPYDSLLSIWTWVDYRWAHYWPIIFGVSGLICLALAWRFAKRGQAVGIIFVSATLLLAVLLDANALAQFAIIAAAALWLLAFVIPIQPVNLTAIPVAGLATLFLFLDHGANTPNAFFFDVWAGTGARLWPMPQSGQGAAFLGHLFSLGLVAAVVYAIVSRAKPSWLYWPVAKAAAAGICVLLVVWALQPAIWKSAFSGAPGADVPDFDHFLTTRYGQVALIGPDVVQVSYPETLITASRKGTVEPSAGLELSVGDLFARETADSAQTPQSWPDRAVIIPEWQRLRPLMESLWVEVLVGSHSWTRTSPPRVLELALRANDVSVPAISATVVTDGWAIVDFKVPSALVDVMGRLDLLPSPSSLLWNGSAKGPWVRILPASGTLHALVDLQPTDATFHLNDEGEGSAIGFPLKSTYRVQLYGVDLPKYTVHNAFLRWPNTPELWKRNPWFKGLGAGYGLLVLGATAWLLTLCLNPMPMRPMHDGERDSMHQSWPRGS